MELFLIVSESPWVRARWTVSSPRLSLRSSVFFVMLIRNPFFSSPWAESAGTAKAMVASTRKKNFVRITLLIDRGGEEVNGGVRKSFGDSRGDLPGCDWKWCAENSPQTPTAHPASK